MDPETNELLQAAEKLLDVRRLSEALQGLRDAERAGAAADRCAAGRWTGWMLCGDFASAWRESDAIRGRGGLDPHRFWDGEPIDGKRLILRCLHGLGDAVQMLRYLPLLQQRCASVTVEVPPGLLTLAPYFAGADCVITWGDLAPAEPPSWEVQVEVMELPYLFRTMLQDLPLASRYLCLPETAVQHTTCSMGATTVPRVGIVWSASGWDPTRCLPLPCLQALLAVPGLEFWNLQGGAQRDQIQGAVDPGAMRDAAQLGDGLLPLATVIAGMDLVLTVDTLAAHLAGAMGRAAWVMLQHRADWRWMHARDDSPWYPTLRLFRQPVQDDWAAVTRQVCNALGRWREQQ